MIQGQHPVEVLERHQGALVRNTAAHQPGARTGDGDLDAAAGHLLHYGRQLGLAPREEEVVEGPAGKFGFVGEVGRVLGGDVLETVYAAHALKSTGSTG